MAFDSSTFKDAELNYSIHKKELLAIICALKKWQSDLVSPSFFVFTDHKTLENFDTQKELSHQQAKWIEVLSQYDAHFVYVKGEHDSVANALSRQPIDSTSTEAERNVTQPYPASLKNDEYTLALIFNPVDMGPLCMVAALMDGQEDRPTTPFFPFSMKITTDKTLFTGPTRWLPVWSLWI